MILSRYHTMCLGREGCHSLLIIGHGAVVVLER